MPSVESAGGMVIRAKRGGFLRSSCPFVWTGDLVAMPIDDAIGHLMPGPHASRKRNGPIVLDPPSAAPFLFLGRLPGVPPLTGPCSLTNALRCYIREYPGMPADRVDWAVNQSARWGITDYNALPQWRGFRPPMSARLAGANDDGWPPSPERPSEIAMVERLANLRRMAALHSLLQDLAEARIVANGRRDRFSPERSEILPDIWGDDRLWVDLGASGDELQEGASRRERGTPVFSAIEVRPSRRRKEGVMLCNDIAATLSEKKYTQASFSGHGSQAEFVRQYLSDNPYENKGSVERELRAIIKTLP